MRSTAVVPEAEVTAQAFMSFVGWAAEETKPTTGMLRGNDASTLNCSTITLSDWLQIANIQLSIFFLTCLSCFSMTGVFNLFMQIFSQCI